MKIKRFIDWLFRRKKQELTREQKVSVMLEDLSVLFNVVEDALGKEGLNRSIRKQFWRDFIKNKTMRRDIFEDIVKNKKISDGLLDRYVKLKGV